MKPNNDAAREKETETLVAIQNILAQYDDVLSPHLGLTLARYCEAFAAEQTAELRAEVDSLKRELQNWYDKLIAADDDLAAEKERREADILDAKIQLLREIQATAIDQFGKDRAARKSVNDYTGNLLRQRETELTKEQFQKAYPKQPPLDGKED